MTATPVKGDGRVAIPADTGAGRPYGRAMIDIDGVIAAVAAGQAGTISRRQLLDAGVGSEPVRTAVEGGRLISAHRGVYRVAGAPANTLQDLWAAHLALGDTSVISHGSAAGLCRLHAVQPGPPTLTVPHDRSVRRRSGLIIRRSRHLDAVDVTVMDGLPVTSPTRTIVDLAGEYSRSRMSAMLEEAHHSRDVSYTRVGETLLRVGGPGRAGTRLLADLLDEFAGGRDLEQSVLERLLAELLERADIGPWVRQHPLPGLGRVEGTVDVYLHLLRMIIEADGRRWHARRADMLRDRDRDFEAAQVGVQTVRFMHENLTGNMDGCVAGLRRIAETRRGAGQRLALPRP